MSKRLLRLQELRSTILVPAPVVGEWWKGRSDWREKILRPMRLEVLDGPLAKLAGEATAKVGGATLVDAVVMACAARAGARSSRAIRAGRASACRDYYASMG